jgi:hypothetical protein
MQSYLLFCMDMLHNISHPGSRACSRLRLFVKRMLGRIEGSQKEVKEHGRQIPNFMLYNFHYVSLGSGE